MASVLNALIAVGSVSLSARLYFLGLHRRYRAFFLFLIFSALQSGVAASLNPTGDLYQKVWVLTEPIGWFCYVWVVLELYALVLQDYMGLYTVGRWSLIAAICVALAASWFSLIVPSHSTHQGHLMRYYYVAERAVYFSLVVFLLTILVLLTRYPIALNRNIIVHSMVFSMFFLSNTVIFLLLSTAGFGAIRLATYAIQGVDLGALGIWLAMLNTAGEHRRQTLRPAWIPGREEQMLGQLNSLNVALLRVSRLR
jgi:hypothetical protein